MGGCQYFAFEVKLQLPASIAGGGAVNF